MANEIKLKRGSGSDPGTSDLSVGEIAIRTDNGKLFTKRDNGTVTEITGGGGIDDGDKGDITVSSSGATFTIDNGVVSTAKIADAAITNAKLATNSVSQAKMLNDSVGSNEIVDGSVTTAKIADDAVTAAKLANPIALPDDHKISFGTGSGNNLEIFHESTSNTNEIIAADGDIHIQCDDFMLISDSTSGRAIYLDEGNSRLELGFDGNDDAFFTGSGVTFNTNVDATAGLDVTGNITVSGTVDGRDVATDGTKLDGIESGATADQTASEILTLIKTVDGAGSGLDADTLDGISSASFVRSDADDSFTGTITGTSDQTNPVIKITGGGPNFIRFDSNDVSSDSIDLIYRTDPNTLAFERVSDAQIMFSVDADNQQALFAGNLDVGAGLDVTGNISVSGTVDGRDLATDGSKLDGIASGATNVTNTNQLTNGAGFITATLTNEQVQDIVGGMVSSNTESGITVTYQDSDGTLDFVVGTLNQDTTGNAASADTIDVTGSGTDSSFALTFVASTGSAKSLLADTSGLVFNPYSNTLTTNNFNGGGASLTNLNASNITSGTLASARIADDAVTNAKIANNAVDTAQLAAGSVQHSKLDGDAVDGDNIADNSINSEHYVDGSIDTAHIANSAVTNAKINSMAASKLTGALPAIDGSSLTGISAGATGGGSDEIFYENGQTVTTNYTITNGKNAMAAGPITINSGVTVTVGSGETLTIV